MGGEAQLAGPGESFQQSRTQAMMQASLCTVYHYTLLHWDEFLSNNAITLHHVSWQEEADLEALQERERAIRQLESDIVDVNTIFKVMAVVVRRPVTRTVPVYRGGQAGVDILHLHILFKSKISCKL